MLLVNHAVKEQLSQKPKVNRASSPYGGLFNYTNKKNVKREDGEIFMCAPDLNEIYNHSVHKEFGKYIFFAYYVQPLYSVCVQNVYFFLSNLIKLKINDSQ